MTIRKATKEDIPEVKELCVQTILSVNKRDYTDEEVKDWASCGESFTKWEQRLNEQIYWVCVQEQELIGLVSLKENNYLGSFFVHKNHQKKGVGNLLMNHVLTEAKLKGTKIIESEVSITAKPFFERYGFRIIKKQLAKANKLHLINFVMEKEL